MALDEPHVRIQSICAVGKRFCYLLREARRTVATLVALGPLHESAIVNGNDMGDTVSRSALVEWRKDLVQ